jgi:hypothetical protein
MSDDEPVFVWLNGERYRITGPAGYITERVDGVGPTPVGLRLVRDDTTQGGRTIRFPGVSR